MKKIFETPKVDILHFSIQDKMMLDGLSVPDPYEGEEDVVGK